MTQAAIEHIAQRARELLPWIVERRRHLHRHPELSFQETRTAAFIEAELRALGYEHLRTRLNGNCGLCAELGPPDAPRTIALRADIDALPIQEETPWEDRSTVDGVSHMCGHDAHTAMLLGAARLLKEREPDLSCRVRLFFQHAEEQFPGGARDFIQAGLLEDVEAIYGIHVDPSADTGTFAIRAGDSLAGIGVFTLRVIGRGGHAAYPHLCRDPVLAASQIVVALQQIISRRIDPFEPGVLTVATIHGGEAYNVIPTQVELKGTYRSFRPDMHEFFPQAVREIANQTAAAHGCRAEAEFAEGYPPLVNDPRAVETMRGAARGLFDGRVFEHQPVTVSEDFALYTQHLPSAFGFLGVSKADDKERHGLHHPRFHLDEEALWRGAALHAAIALSP